MISIVRRLIGLLQPAELRRAAILLGVVIVSGLLETLGVASIVPLLAVLAHPELIMHNATLHRLYTLAGSGDPESFAALLGLGALVAIVFANGAGALTQWLLSDFGFGCAHSISRRLLQNYLRQPYVFFLNRNSSELAKNILAEVTHLTSHVLLPAVKITARSIVCLFIMILLLLVDPLLTLAAVVALGVAYGGIYAVVHGRVQRLGKRRLEAETERFRVASESFLGIKEIKLFGREDAYLDRYDLPSRRTARYYAMSEIIATLPRYVLETVAFGGILAAVLYLIHFKGGFAEAVPVIGLFAFAAQRLLPSLQQIFFGASLMRFGLPTLVKIGDEFQKTAGDAVVETGRAAAPLPFRESIELDGLRFAYPGATRPVIDNVTLRIAAGDCVAFVGATGSGKTTLIDLLCGLLVPDAGKIRIDGVPLDAQLRLSWRRSIGYVPQMIYLTDDTVARNIAFGIPDKQIDRGRVEAAARLARVHDFVASELPAGYDTVIGDNGVRLSGGQRQRLGIARALYHDPPLIVLDEATSALDNATESAVMDAVNALARQKTVLIIAHRITTVQRCDQIFLVDQGRLKVCGTYDNLLEHSPEFRRLAQASDAKG
jgi:ABC-type multidrug transport system fused ATPase/permease subunit